MHIIPPSVLLIVALIGFIFLLVDACLHYPDARTLTGASLMLVSTIAAYIETWYFPDTFLPQSFTQLGVELFIFSFTLLGLRLYGYPDKGSKDSESETD